MQSNDLFNHSPQSSLLELVMTEKERKRYQDRVQKLHIRLKNIKQKESEYAVKISAMRQVQKNKKYYIDYKEKMQKQIINQKLKMSQEKEMKRQSALNDKLCRSQSMIEIKEKMKKINEKISNESKANKIMNDTMFEQFKSYQVNEKKCQILNAKMERSNFLSKFEKYKKDCYIKKQNNYQKKLKNEQFEIEKLKNTLNALEEKESQMLKKLGETKALEDKYYKKDNLFLFKKVPKSAQKRKLCRYIKNKEDTNNKTVKIENGNNDLEHTDENGLIDLSSNNINNSNGIKIFKHKSQSFVSNENKANRINLANNLKKENLYMTVEQKLNKRKSKEIKKNRFSKIQKIEIKEKPSKMEASEGISEKPNSKIEPQPYEEHEKSEQISEIIEKCDSKGNTIKDYITPEKKETTS